MFGINLGISGLTLDELADMGMAMRRQSRL